MPGKPDRLRVPLPGLPADAKPGLDLQVLEGTVADILFRNESNGYTVVVMAGPEEQAAVGIFPFIVPGETVRMFGKWTLHPDYGRQFQADRYELVIPHTLEAIQSYLGSGLIKGIGKKTAERLVRQFGQDTLEILRHHPEQTAGLKGIGHKRAQDVARQLQEKQDFQDLVLLLNPLGIGTGKILRIYRQYGCDAIRLVSENPYQLADEVYGIGFLTADKLARDMGLDPQAESRVAGALRYVLNQALGSGHTCLPLDRLLAGASQLLDLPLFPDHPALQALLTGRQITFPKEFTGQGDSRPVSPGSLNDLERQAAERLLALLGAPPARFANLRAKDVALREIQDSCRRQDMELAAEQQLALLEALRQPLLILTGGPGTGKTTIIRLLCDCLGHLGGKVVLAAPTGRAARRMAEATGHVASTLHRLLEIRFDPDQSRGPLGYRAGSAAKVDCDLLIVDEASMIDIFLFRALLDAVTPGTRLVFVGDADQLPSVGPGYVLKDMIDSGRVPVARLTQVFRQSSSSLIIRNAHRIHDGQWPELDQSHDSHFLLITKEKAQDIAPAVVKLCRAILPEQYGFDPWRDVQVLTPAHKGQAGTVALNSQLRDALQAMRPPAAAGLIEAHGCRFSCGDKVMQNRNNYDMVWYSVGDRAVSGSGVFNGETGMVVNIDTDADCLTVEFDDERQAAYDRLNLEDLDLAYAITIHKSQGSEYPVVVLAIPPGAPQLLSRNLLYTAVTRARQKLLLITSRRTLAAMLANNQAYKRYTLLKDYLTLDRTANQV